MNTKVLKVFLISAISLTIALPAFARGGGFGGFRGGGGGGFGGFRGGGGGFGGGSHDFGGGGFGGGSHDFGGGGFGGGSHDFGGGGFGGGSHDFGGGGFGGRQSQGREFGGGFNSMGGGKQGGFENHGGQGFGGQGGFENRGGQGMGGQGGFENRGGQGMGGQGGFQNRGGQGLGNRPDQPISSRPNLPTDGGLGGVSGLQNRTPHNISQTNLQNQGQSVRNSFNNNQINHNNSFSNTNNYNVNRYGGYGGYGGYHGYANGYAHGWANSNAYHGYWGGAGCWGYPGCSEAAMWTCMGVSSLTTFLGMGLMGAEIAGSNKGSAPASTTNVTYQGDTVYVNGQPSGTSTQYYQSAQQLAAQAYAQGQSDALAAQNNGSYPPVAPPITGDSSSSQSSDWAPLGVFSLAEPGQTQSNMMLQLAINKQGILRGNYLNQLTNERSQIYGALDKKTQRVSWTIGENNTTVFDTTIGDLTKDDSQILVHYGPNNTQAMALIRLQQPANAGATDPTAAPGA